MHWSFLLVAACAATPSLWAQLDNAPVQPFEFGLSLAGNAYTVSLSDGNDWQRGTGPGFGLGMLGRYAATDRLTLEVHPTLLFAGADVWYPDGAPTARPNEFESVIVHLPLRLLADVGPLNRGHPQFGLGLAYGYDFAANNGRTNVALQTPRWSWELAAGLELPLRAFTLRPEVVLNASIGDQSDEPLRIRLPGLVRSGFRMLALRVSFYGAG